MSCTTASTRLSIDLLDKCQKADSSRVSSCSCTVLAKKSCISNSVYLKARHNVSSRMRDECRICLQTKEVKRQCQQCNWVSCEECKLEWKKQSNKCPQCRLSLYPEVAVERNPTVTNVEVCLRLSFLFLDCFCMFLLVFALNFVLDSHNCYTFGNEQQCAAIAMMIFFTFTALVCTLRFVLKKYIIECCLFNVNTNFGLLEEHSSDEDEV